MAQKGFILHTHGKGSSPLSAIIFKNSPSGWSSVKMTKKKKKHCQALKREKEQNYRSLKFNSWVKGQGKWRQEGVEINSSSNFL